MIDLSKQPRAWLVATHDLLAQPPEVHVIPAPQDPLAYEELHNSLVLEQLDVTEITAPTAAAARAARPWRN